MEYVGWLLGVNRGAVSEQLRKDAPNHLVTHGGLKSVGDHCYEHVGDVSTTFTADLPFFVNGLVDACGVVLPYWELTCQLAAKSTELWAGFLNVGGAELKRGGPAHIGFDIFETFEVGDVIGIGLYAKTRKLFLCKNGEVLRGEIVEVPASSVKELPAVRIKGTCKFTVNFGDGSMPFAFSPYTYQIRAPAKEKKSKSKDKPKTELL